MSYVSSQTTPYLKVLHLKNHHLFSEEMIYKMILLLDMVSLGEKKVSGTKNPLLFLTLAVDF